MENASARIWYVEANVQIGCSNRFLEEIEGRYRTVEAMFNVK